MSKPHVPLKIVWHNNNASREERLQVLCALLVTESNLVKANKDSALPHLLAVVKEVEKMCGFTFEYTTEYKEWPDAEASIGTHTTIQSGDAPQNLRVS